MKLKKPLNCKSIEELERRCPNKELFKTTNENNDGHELIKKFEDLYSHAKQIESQGDQEEIYVKYLSLKLLHEQIKKKPIYKNDKIYCDLMMQSAVDEITEKCNNLRKSLIERYAQESRLPSYKSIFSSTDFDQSLTSLSLTKDISCKELYELLKKLSVTSSKKVLLIDLRRKEHFNRSSISFKDEKIASTLITLNIPEDKITKGLTSATIEHILNSNELPLFRNRNQAHTVVLMDYESTSLQSNDKLNLLHQALVKFDTTPYRLEEEPRLLKGGFNEWFLTYQMFCSDPSFQMDNEPQSTIVTNLDDDLTINNRFGGDVVERMYSKMGNKDKSIPGSAKYFKPSNEFKHHPASSSNFMNNLSSNFNSSLLTDDDEDSNSPPLQQNKKKVIIHKIHVENDDDDDRSNGSSDNNKFYSKPVSAFKKEPSQDEFSTIFREAPSDIFPSMLSKGRRSKSYTNLNESISMDDEETNYNNNNNDLYEFGRKPSFDRSSKPLFNDITNRPSSLSESIYREFSPVYGTSYHPTGLKNLGNTCFMNSIIQCLFNVKPFSNYFISKTYLKHINRNSKFGTRGELTEEFGVLITQMDNTQVKHISPRDFRRVVGRHISVYSGNEQQDSHEFLLILFEKLHADLNTSQLIKPNVEIPDTMPSKEAIERFWRDHLANNSSVISNLFEGLIMSTLECDTCQKKSNTFEVFTCLSLPIPNNLSSSRCELEDCLREFTKNERMCDEAAWQCPTCKVKRPATKKTSIVKLPRVLIIHLKRFSFEGRWKQKITTFVDFQMQNLNLRHYITYLSNEPSNSSYDLIGVVDHTGSLEGGHYTAICKSERNGIFKWNKYDDQDVSEVSQSEVVSSKAYLLFYVLNN